MGDPGIQAPNAYSVAEVGAMTPEVLREWIGAKNIGKKERGRRKSLFNLAMQKHPLKARLAK